MMVLVLVHCNALINRQVLEELVACRFLAQDLHVVVMCATVVLVLGQVLTVLGSRRLVNKALTVEELVLFERFVL